MNDPIERIKIKLYQLKELDADLEIFGADTHNYNFHPVLTPTEIEDFESRNAVRLPEGYTRFLTEIGNGGAGPFYGLQTLEDSRINFLDTSEKKDHVYFDLSKPFPHISAWNIEEALEALYKKIDEANEARNTELEEKLFEEKWALIGGEEHDYGRLHICEYGCGVRLTLIVNGPEKGNIWTDDRTNDSGIYPTTELGNAEKISFLDWYELWLDISIGKIQDSEA